MSPKIEKILRLKLLNHISIPEGSIKQILLAQAQRINELRMHEENACIPAGKKDENTERNFVELTAQRSYFRCGIIEYLK